MVQLSREVAERWSRLTRCVLTALRVAMEATRVAKQARALAETFPWLAAVNPMLRESASGSGAGSSTQAGYAQDTRSSKHASSRGHAEDPKKEYKHNGISYQACSLCGSRWMQTKHWSVPLDPYPRPGGNPRRTSEKCLGDHVINIGAHKGTKMKDLPERYLKWALAEARRHGDLHGGICGELSYVVAYAMVKGVGDSASSAPLPRCSQSSSDSSASQEGPPQSSVVGELSSHDDF